MIADAAEFSVTSTKNSQEQLLPDCDADPLLDGNELPLLDCGADPLLDGNELPLLDRYELPLELSFELPYSDVILLLPCLLVLLLLRPETSLG
jgi:hypothetical protein